MKPLLLLANGMTQKFEINFIFLVQLSLCLIYVIMLQNKLLCAFNVH